MSERPEHPDDACVLRGRLVNKSVDAYALGLETINRISIRYRVEAFCYLICNAWELLLKAKILSDDGDASAIYYPNSSRSISLGDGLKKTMPNQRDPVRANIERVQKLRDDATHLTISDVPNEVIGLFQACAINYHNRLSKWFGISLSDRMPVGMMSIVYDLDPGRWNAPIDHLHREFGRETADFLLRFRTDLQQDFDDLHQPPEFSIRLDYHLVLTKNPESGDVALVAGKNDANVAGVVEVPKDSSKSHPHRQTEVIEKLRDAGVMVNKHDIQCVNKVYGIKKRQEYFYQGEVPGSPVQFSQAFVDWLIDRYKKDTDFFVKVRAEAKEVA